ncbi:MAG: peptidoglycan DD-metalloendopeptidase family protein [Desulfonauticus sp.]|nr:peptidoglycan DD-metalloendopeptidase family protein [Desulfonauticus sp.]
MSMDYFKNLESVSLEKLNATKLKNISNLAKKKKDLKKLRQACIDFEALFIEKLWKEMRKTVPKEGYLHSEQEDMYLSMFDHELAKVLAKSGGIGLSQFMFEQLKSTVQSSSSPRDFKKIPLSRQQTGLDTRMDRLARQIETKYGPAKGGIPELKTEAIKIDKLEYKLNQETNHFVWPVKRGRISSKFGWRIDPFTGNRAWHPGVDIAVPVGTSVRACMSGKVIFAGPKKGYGNLVIIQHKNGLLSYYGHNSKLLVEPGQFVRFGQKIALSGDSGRSTGPHLHFELRKEDLALNPLKFERVLVAKK